MECSVENRKYVPQRVAENLMWYYQNGFDKLFDDGVAVQQRVLEDLVELSKHSDYAINHGFGNINTTEEFLEHVPMSIYDDYRSYIEANMQKDSEQLTKLETDHYLLSTGYKKQGKYYIETEIGAMARQLSIDIWNMSLTKKEPVMTDPDVKMLAVTNCSPLEEASNGKTVQRASGKAAKVLWERTPQLYVFPYEFLEAAMSEDDRDYLTALYTLKEKNFNMLFCNNLAYFGVLLDWIEKCPQQMIDDIRTGTMTADLQANDRAILEAEFGAHPDRADELQAILAEYGTLPVEKIWPDFVFSGVWLAGSVGSFSRDVQRRLPDTMHYVSEPYGSSEAMLAIPMELNSASGPLAIYSCYFEFLPLEGEKKLLSMAEVEDGAYYELVISNYSGLYRYNLHDIVQIKGFTGTTANIEFCCRTRELYKLEKRNLYGYELTRLVQQVEDELDCVTKVHQGYEKDGRLSVLLQLDDASFDKTVFCQRLQQVLEEQNITLDCFYIMTDDYRDQLYHSLMVNGKTIQTIKLPLIVYEKPEEQFVASVYHC